MLPDELLHLFRLQRGLAARYQIRDLLPNEADRRAIYRHPDLEQPSIRVLRHRATMWTPEQDLMLGVLDAGRDAQLWGKTGACHLGFGRFRRFPPHVVMQRQRLRGERLAEVHQVRHLDPRDRFVHDDIPVARPEAVILWLAGMWTHRIGHERAIRRTATTLDQAWRQRLINGPFLHELAARSGGRGRSGIVVLREVLRQRPPDYRPAGSALEERFEELVPFVVRRHLRRQVVADVEESVKTVDFRLDCWPLVVEINGEVFHSSLTDREADARRYERLLQLGLSVVIFWEYDIWHDADTVRDTMVRLARHPDRVPTLHRPTKAPWQW